MMALHTRKNLYHGVNAHLHSYLQYEDDGWSPFHSSHITHIAERLDTLVPLGYEVSLEKSLQLSEYYPETDEGKRYRPQPDVIAYDIGAQPQSYGSSTAVLPDLTLQAIEFLEYDEEDAYLTAVIVKQIIKEARIPVLRLELLSPTNKPKGDGWLHYRDKRNRTLQSRVPLIEIDYLHETRAPSHRIPSYPDREPNAYPYVIIITDPRPTLAQGLTRVFGIGVDQALPPVEVPLAGDDKVMLDLNSVYDRTFEGLRAFSNRVDYAALPVNVESYHPDDQARIRAVMERAAAELTAS